MACERSTILQDTARTHEEHASAPGVSISTFHGEETTRLGTLSGRLISHHLLYLLAFQERF